MSFLEKQAQMKIKDKTRLLD